MWLFGKSAYLYVWRINLCKNNTQTHIVGNSSKLKPTTFGSTAPWTTYVYGNIRHVGAYYSHITVHLNKHIIIIIIIYISSHISDRKSNEEIIIHVGNTRWILIFSKYRSYTKMSTLVEDLPWINYAQYYLFTLTLHAWSLENGWYITIKISKEQNWCVSIRIESILTVHEVTRVAYISDEYRPSDQYRTYLIGT